jgi:NADH-quinone oxidoreductase subunit M
MLLGILAVYFYAAGQTGTYTFDVLELMRVAYPSTPVISLLGVSLSFQDLVWLAFAIAFAIKVPMFPFHTWLPDAHTEAPTAGSVILAGVLQDGDIHFLRFTEMFPEASQHLYPWSSFAIIAIIYGAMVCMVQPDMKRLIAHSFGQPGFRHAGHVRFQSSGRREPPADDQPRALHRRLFRSWAYLRPAAHPPDRRAGGLPSRCPFMPPFATVLFHGRRG